MKFFFSEKDGLREKEVVRRAVGLPLILTHEEGSEDFFGKSELCVWYEEDKLSGVEIYSPSEFYLDGIQLIGKSYAVIERLSREWLGSSS